MTELFQLSRHHLKLYLSKNTALCTKRQPLSFLFFYCSSSHRRCTKRKRAYRRRGFRWLRRANKTPTTASRPRRFCLPRNLTRRCCSLGWWVARSLPWEERVLLTAYARTCMRDRRPSRLSETAEEESPAVAVRAGDTHAFRIKRQNARPSQSAASFPPWGNSALLADARVFFLFLRSLPVAIFAQRSIAFKVNALGSCLCVTFEDEQNEVCRDCGLRTTSGGSLAKTSVSFATACLVATVSRVCVCV